jgi:hypothetical protein
LKKIFFLKPTFGYSLHTRASTTRTKLPIPIPFTDTCKWLKKKYFKTYLLLQPSYQSLHSPQLSPEHSFDFMLEAAAEAASKKAEAAR